VTDRVKVSIADGVADVRLDRPDKLNALDGHLMAGLAEAGAALAEDPTVRAVVLSGEGRSFCAGLDLASFQAMAGDASQVLGGDGAPNIAGTSGRITHLGQQAAWTWRELAVPVVGAIHGNCLGGGLQIALGTDIRIVAPDAKLSVLEMRWGLIPDMTGTWILPRLVGYERALELTATGRMVSGTEAVEIGLCSRLADDPLAAALDLAGEIASKSPVAVRHAKRLLLESVGGRSVADQFADERTTMGSLIGSPDNVEAVTAYFEKRPPVFPDAR
jgi:enoyl-CoA hydratase/carnithine racemase